MDKTILPIGHPIDARVSVPGSKSATNRALVLAALAEGTTTLHGAVDCDDSRRMLAALTLLGFQIDGAGPSAIRPGGACGEARLQDAASVRDCAIVVHGTGGDVAATSATLDVGNAGTAARFVTALVTLGRGRFVIDGDARMRERPMAGLVDALGRLGARIDSSHGGVPLAVQAAGLQGGRTAVSGAVSSQFLSALLMVAPYARTPVSIRVTAPLSSRPYVDLTLSMMEDFGVEVREEDLLFSVDPRPYRSPPAYEIEPDASSASYVYAAAAIVGGRSVVNGMTRKCRQGDIGFLDILARMGCRVSSTPAGIEVERSGHLHGVDADLRDMPDVAPTLAAIAPFARSVTRITGIESARRKECDRVSALCAELSRMGVGVTEHRDGLTIQPCGLVTPARIHTYNDHRIAMAFALVGLRCAGISIECPECVAKSFPRYFDMLEGLGS